MRFLLTKKVRNMCVLSKHEQFLEKIVDAIRKEKSTLKCINILKRFIIEFPDIKVYYSDDDRSIHKEINSLSNFFTLNKINPNLLERFFVSEEVEFSGRCEWVATNKYYEHEKNQILIYCKDAKDFEPVFYQHNNKLLIEVKQV